MSEDTKEERKVIYLLERRRGGSPQHMRCRSEHRGDSHPSQSGEESLFVVTPGCTDIPHRVCGTEVEEEEEL